MNIYLYGVAFTFTVVVVVANELARGFNDDIDWVTFEDGKKLCTEQNKPMLLLIHKTWCGACKALKPHFTTSKEIEEMSKQFIMVNLVDDEEPSDKAFAPDGTYIPRIIFIDSSGNVLSDVINEKGNESYKYYYHSPEDIVESMRRVLSQQTEQRPISDEL